MKIFKAYPVTRTMASYAVLYPVANLVQQKVTNRDRNEGLLEGLDGREAFRFMLYGTLCHAPLVHNGLKLVAFLFPGTSVKQLCKKVKKNWKKNMKKLSALVPISITLLKSALCSYL